MSPSIHSIVDCTCYKTQTLLKFLKTQHLNQENLLYIRKSNICSISWISKKQTWVSHSSQESELISMDICLRMDEILTLDLCDVMLEVLSSSKNIHQAVKDHCRKEKVDDQLSKCQARSEIWSITPTPNRKKKQLSRSWWIIYWGSRCHTRKTFSYLSSFEHFWRQWDYDQNNHKGQKSYDETRVSNPQSYVRLIVWQSQLWSPRSKSNMLTSKTNSLTYWLKIVSRLMNRSIFFVYSVSWISRRFLTVIFFRTESRAPWLR